MSVLVFDSTCQHCVSMFFKYLFVSQVTFTHPPPTFSRENLVILTVVSCLLCMSAAFSFEEKHHHFKHIFGLNVVSDENRIGNYLVQHLHAMNCKIKKHCDLKEFSGYGVCVLSTFQSVIFFLFFWLSVLFAPLFVCMFFFICFCPDKHYDIDTTVAILLWPQVQGAHFTASQLISNWKDNK